MSRPLPLVAVTGATATAIAATLSLGTGAAAPTQPTTTAASRVRTIVYTLHGSEARMTFLGSDENHPKAGDRLVEHAPLYRNGRRDGHMINVCTVVTTAGDGDELCEQTLETREGQLVLAGSGNPQVVPIIGGSGGFAFATGHVIQRPTKNGGKFIVRYARSL